MASPLPSALPRLSLLSKPSPPQHHRLLLAPTRPQLSRFECLAGQTGFFTRLGRLIKEKAKSDVEKLFSGFSKTRDNLAVIDELLLYWNLADTDRVLDELEEALLVSDFGPKITIKIVESLREDIVAGKLKSGSEIKEALKKSVLDLLTTKGSKTELQLGYRKPAVVMIVGVNGGGKTTSLGKLAYRLKKEGAKVLMAAGDTFRAAACDQLEIWAERTGCEIVVAEKEKAKASSVISQAVKRGKEQGYDIVLCDTSGRLHTNYSLMEELIACKKAVSKVIPGAPNEILQVLDGTTGLNMLPQAREFNEMLKRSRNFSSHEDGVVEVDEKGKDGPYPQNNEFIFIDLMDEEISKGNRSTTIFSQTSWQTMISELHTCRMFEKGLSTQVILFHVTIHKRFIRIL
ncbi:cell division protein FtsY homolog, chloroplastic isoform X1 [Prunus dulcis]|uniref:cell division protein FtsY homolog, chloroplastic isoform X1 n=1 Tax=Prunus dulcis TaxID=3755 RepID=UPI0014836FA4|nr:cell division protein FtsY homolog, chloroplastic isoform X1 [Prunus dulcis]